VVVTFISTATEDGWVLESAQGSGTGGSINDSTNTFWLGDDASNRQFRAILSFNTSSLPANAVVQSAVLKIKYNSLVGTDPFTALGSLRADIIAGSYNSNAALETADFNATGSASAVGTFNETPTNGWYSATLNATGESSINLNGRTQFRLRFSTATTANSTADAMRFIAGDFTSNQPELIITYTLP
jgi:hypothetical protein